MPTSPIVNLADFLTFTGQTAVPNEDTVSAAIRAAQAYAEGRCARIFALANATTPNQHVWTFDGSGEEKIFTPYAPVTSVVLIESYESDAFEAIDTANYTAVISGSGSYIFFREGYLWTSGTQNWRVTYNWGFTTIPADLKRAILLTALAFSKVSLRSPDLQCADGRRAVVYLLLADGLRYTEGRREAPRAVYEVRLMASIRVKSPLGPKLAKIRKAASARTERVLGSIGFEIEKQIVQNLSGRVLNARTGRLRASWQQPGYRVEKITFGWRLKFSSDSAYARIHELGGMTGRGHKTKIPKRPYVRTAVAALIPRLRKELGGLYLSIARRV